MYYIVTLGEFQSTAWCTWILTFHYGWTNGFFNHGMPAITLALLYIVIIVNKNVFDKII